MSKKVDYPELRAQLETLNNKELHHKCVENGLNVPVADSTRDVIIRKLIKSITGDTNIASPKGNKKPTSTPNERRKTVNVTVHVSSDEEEAERQSRSQNIKTRTRTQSPKGHNVTFDTTTNNNNRRSNAALSSETKTQNLTQRKDVNANAGVGLSSSSRILPIEVDLTKNTERDDYTTEIHRSNSGTSLNYDVNRGMYNSTPVHMNKQNTAYGANTTNMGFNQPNTFNSNYQDVRDIPLSGYKAASPNLGFSQTRNTTYQQDEHTSSRHGFISTTPESILNRSLGYYSPGSPPTAFNNENKASHSSTLGNSYGSGSSPPTQETLFKRPTALSKTNVTNTSYNKADAQRLYPRLPNDLPTPPSYSSPQSTSLDTQQQSMGSKRAPSLTKSGVMTTSYYQEISPVKDVKHFEEEIGDEPAIIDGAADYNPHSNASIGGTNYERSSYLAGNQRGRTETHLPFESTLQSTMHDTLDAVPRYSSSPLRRETYVPSAVAPKPSSPTNIKRYTNTGRGNTSYTRTIDEPDSGSESEKLSCDEIYVHDSDEDEYMPENKKIYSSFGSNKIQERVPYRRSHTAKLSSSPSTRYSNQTPVVGRNLLHPVDDNNDDVDDVNASLRNFLTTLDRKYHIKQMLYMFGIFAAAVFVYVVFFEKDTN